jgi:hypothetical protein
MVRDCPQPDNRPLRVRSMKPDGPTARPRLSPSPPRGRSYTRSPSPSEDSTKGVSLA